MARLPALVTALAATDGRDRPTLDHIARVVREAGWITTTKRGGGAAGMTVRDAANLLIGANAVQSPKLAALAVQQFRTLKQSPHGRRNTGKVFGRLAQCDTFGEAIEVLVEDAPILDTMFRNWADNAYGQRASEFYKLICPRLSVRFSIISANISVFVNRTGSEQVEHEWQFHADVDLMFARFYTLPQGGADRRVTVEVGLPTFLSLHKTVFGAQGEARE